MHEDIQWFIGFIAIIVILWFSAHRLASAPQSPSASTTPKEARQTNASPPSGAPAQRPPANPQNQSPLPYSYYNGQNGAGSYPPAAGQSGRAEAPAPDPNASPLRGKLVVSSVSRGASSSSAGEYAVIRASANNRAPVVISGLILHGAFSRLSATIPKAWKLPFPGSQGDGEEAALGPGEVAYLLSGRSPNGMSFELNRCTGYFEQALDFSPALPIECPAPRDEPLPLPPNQLSDRCYDYLSTLPACRVPGPVPLYLSGDGSCQAHIQNNINYDRCVEYHKNEPGFFRGDWRIYFNRDSKLFRDRRDIAELLDENGKVIDAYGF